MHMLHWFFSMAFLKLASILKNHNHKAFFSVAAILSYVPPSSVHIILHTAKKRVLEVSKESMNDKGFPAGVCDSKPQTLHAYTRMHICTWLCIPICRFVKYASILNKLYILHKAVTFSRYPVCRISRNNKPPSPHYPGTHTYTRTCTLYEKKKKTAWLTTGNTIYLRQAPLTSLSVSSCTRLYLFFPLAVINHRTSSYPVFVLWYKISVGLTLSSLHCLKNLIFWL